MRKAQESGNAESGTYCAGVKDLASAYVLCPRLTERCVFLFEGSQNHGRDLGKGYGGNEGRKECGKVEKDRIGLRILNG